MHTETWWGFRQKRYKRKRQFFTSPKVLYNPVTYQPIGNTTQNTLIDRRLLKKGPSTSTSTLTQSGIASEFDYVRLFFKKKNTVASENSLNSYSTLPSSSPVSSASALTLLTENQPTKQANPYDYYRSVRVAKQRTDLLSITLARRLLRVKRTLVLPVHINITVITNSYDVVHSWFLPGLGLKMDCVPGRSTHHTFYIDNVGLYYGQCAEICGRYHHHMPIRVCALNFDQFLVWWFKKGLPRLNRLNARVRSKKVNGYDVQNSLKPLNDENKPSSNILASEGEEKTTLKRVSYKYNW